MLRAILTLAISIATLSSSVGAASFPSPPLYPSFTTAKAKAVLTKFAISSSYTVPNSINAKGQVAGFAQKKSGSYAFIRAQNGSVTLFKILAVNALINNADVVAGAYENSKSVTGGFVRGTTGTVSYFDFPQPTGGAVVAINASGSVLGQFHTHHGDTTAFVRTSDGKMTTFRIGGNSTVAGGTSTIARAMNDDGTITGSCFSASLLDTLGFVRAANGTVTKFHVGLRETDPMSINTSGAIAGGYYDDENNEQGFLRSPDGTIKVFRFPRALQTMPVAINDAGRIIGTYEDSFGDPHNFVRAPDGDFVSFDVPGAVWSDPVAINSKGAITGLYENENNNRLGFIRTP